MNRSGRLARAVSDARDISAELAAALLSLDGSVHDPNDPIGRLLFNALATAAEFQSRSTR